jgi:hypothetical protein
VKSIPAVAGRSEESGRPGPDDPGLGVWAEHLDQPVRLLPVGLPDGNRDEWRADETRRPS